MMGLLVASGCGGGTKAPAALPPPTPTVSDLVYATASPLQRLDLYLPKENARPSPVVVYIHGGGWRVGDKVTATGFPHGPIPTLRSPTSCNDIVQVQVPDVAALTARGYAVAAIDYRLNRDPVAALKDAKAAVRFLRADASRYHLDTGRFASWGDSAGGYSAIMLGLTGGVRTAFDDPALGNLGVSSAVQAVVDWFGTVDLDNMPGNNGQAESPFTYITRGRSLPPFMIAHGDADCVVPVSASRHLYQVLTGVGTTATLNILRGAAHEDPAFMRTQSAPALAFLKHTFNQ